MTLDLKEIIKIHSDMLRPCPRCGQTKLMVEENITRVTVYDVKTEKVVPQIIFTDPVLHYGFRCVDCKHAIYSKTKKLKDEKNYFEVLANLFKDMEHAKIKARLNYTRQSTIKESVKQ
jgi:hypothetical protein